MKTFACSADDEKLLRNTTQQHYYYLFLQSKKISCRCRSAGTTKRLQQEIQDERGWTGGRQRRQNLATTAEQAAAEHVRKYKRLGHGKTVWTYTLTNPVFSL